MLTVESCVWTLAHRFLANRGLETQKSSMHVEAGT
jgi:hypothetical protein